MLCFFLKRRLTFSPCSFQPRSASETPEKASVAETSEGILNKEAGRAFRLCGVIDGAQSLMNHNENKGLTFNFVLSFNF